MNEFKFRLALLGLITICLIYFSSVAVASMNTGATGNPKLRETRVSPERGSWGSTFTYEVIYTDNENNMPAVGYPKVYINGSPGNMVEKDPMDNDVTDGKVYKYDWVTTRENVGFHSFYCYVETSTGENARDPATATYDGPLVDKWFVFLSCEVNNPEPAIGETITFSGHLRTTEENLVGKNLILDKLFLDNNYAITSSATTDENGYFTLQLEVPDSGIFCYKVQFPGDNYYEVSECPVLYVNTLDKPMVFGIYAVILLSLVGVIVFLLSRGIARADYLKPVLLGFGLGFLLMFIGGGILALLAAGGIAGYLFARATPKWTKHLRVGCMIGFLFLLVNGLLLVCYLAWAPAVLGLGYSVTQAEVFGILFYQIIFRLMDYVLMIGTGAMLGGMLRKLLKPPEPKPTTVAVEPPVAG